MARTNATNFSGGLQFPYATAAADIFKKEDVQTLAQAVDQHDHASGKGVLVTGLADGIVTSSKLASGLTLSGATVCSGTLSVTGNTGISGDLSVVGNAGVSGGTLSIGTAGGSQGQLALLHPSGHVSHIRGGASGMEWTNSANSVLVMSLNDTTGTLTMNGDLHLGTAVNQSIYFGDCQMLAPGSAYIQTNGSICMGVGPNGYRIVLPNAANGTGQGYANAWVTYSSIDHARQYNLNVTPIDDPMGKVQAISGYHYDHMSFDAEGNPILDAHGTPESNPMYGFAASEVEPILPEMVAHDPDGTPSGVDLDRMVVILWQAVRELAGRVAALEAA